MIQLIRDIIYFAEMLLGSSYQYGAYAEPRNDWQSAFDCSSFIQYIFGKNGVSLPRSTVLQAATPGEEISKDTIKAGDVLFFEGEHGHYRHDLFPGRKLYIGHVGLYTGDNEIIHACNSNGFSGVIRQKIVPAEHQLYNFDTIVLAKRFV